MKTIMIAFSSLLADVSEIIGISEIRESSELGFEWCFKEAPKLDKQMLGWLDGRETEPVFPACLTSLWLRCRESDVVAIRCMRQLLQFCYKSLVTHSPADTEMVISKYETTDREVGIGAGLMATQSPRLLGRVRRHIQSVLYPFDVNRMVPGHGPGASTTPKDNWGLIPDMLDCGLATTDWLYPSKDVANEHEGFTSELPQARLTAVPKDSRGPRLICVHPAPLMWIQQAARMELERCICMRRSSRQGSVWPSGYVNFDDQTVNGRIALDSSLSREFATLDLSEASDRLSDVLVQALFGPMYRIFGCCRAPLVAVKGKSPMLLNAYAPMGNATVFPVQSLVFWSICVAALEAQGFRPIAYVFGDDIEVPTEGIGCVINALESFGLKVNKGKTFATGYFRESCGVDAFKGVDVTPLRYKCPPQLRSLRDLQAACDLATRLRAAGYLRCAASLFCEVRRIFRERYNRTLGYTNNPDHGGIAEYTEDYLKYRRFARWNSKLHLLGSYIHRLVDRSAEGPGLSRNSLLESLCLLEAKDQGRVNKRDAWRRQRLVRQWCVAAT
jgi:hypothetical protein